jgi:hypothetical protein
MLPNFFWNQVPPSFSFFNSFPYFGGQKFIKKDWVGFNFVIFKTFFAQKVSSLTSGIPKILNFLIFSAFKTLAIISFLSEKENGFSQLKILENCQ